MPYLKGRGYLRLTLAYEGDDIVPTTVGGAIKTTVGARNFNPAIIAGLFPADVAAQVRRLLDSALPGLEGPREVALSLTIGRIYSGLEPMGRELNTYFRGPVDRVDVDGVVAIVKRNLPNVKPTTHAKLEVDETQRRTLAARPWRRAKALPSARTRASKPSTRSRVSGMASEAPMTCWRPLPPVAGRRGPSR